MQKEAARERRRSMGESKDRHFRRKNVDEASKTSAPVDHSAFEGRHGMPRDPTDTPSEAVPVPDNSPDPAVSDVKNKSENSTLVGVDKVQLIVNTSPTEPDPDRISFMRYGSPSREAHPHAQILSFQGVGAHLHSTSFRFLSVEGMCGRRSKEVKNGENYDHGEDINISQCPNYLTRHTMGRNAQFFGLSKAERDHLGGMEYRAITLLSYVVPAYFVLWQLLGCVFLGAYMSVYEASIAREDGINP